MKRFLLPLVLVATLAFGATPALAHHHGGGFGGYGHHGFYGGYGGHHHGFYGGYGLGYRPYYGGFGYGYPSLGYGYGYYPGFYSSPMYGFGLSSSGFGGMNYGVWNGFGGGF